MGSPVEEWLDSTTGECPSQGNIATNNTYTGGLSCSRLSFSAVQYNAAVCGMSAAQRSANLVHESGTVYDYASCTTRTAAAELEPSHMAATGEESAHESKAASALSAVKAAAQSFGHALRSLWPF